MMTDGQAQGAGAKQLIRVETFSKHQDHEKVRPQKYAAFSEKQKMHLEEMSFMSVVWP